MKKFKLLIIALLLFVPMSAYAAVGVAIELGGGSGSFDEDYVNPQTDVDSSYSNISFVYDSNPYAEHSNFSYRLNVGLERHDFDDEFNDTIETGALVFDNTFAFTVARSNNATLWLGPQVRIGFIGGETAATYSGDPVEYSGAMFGLGVALGTNIKASENMGFSLSAGLRSTGLAGETTWGYESDDFTGSVQEGYVNAAILFN